MKSKKITTFFILAAMLAGVVSCGSGNGDVVTTGGEATDTTTAGETEIHDNLPELNYNGDEFTILVEDYGGYCGADFYVEESDGDVVNDAIYNRNRKVSERLNLDLDWVMFTHSWEDRSEFTTKFRSSVQSGTGEYNLAAGLGYFMPSFTTDGLLADMSELPYIDIEKPWWSDEFMKASSVDDKYYFVTGDASLGLIKNMFCIFENLTLAEKLNVENLYDVVREGKWTVDKMKEVAASQYIDLDGDTNVSREDQFGLLLSSGNHITGFSEALGVKSVENQDGEFRYIYGNSHNVDVVDKLEDIIWKNEGVFFDPKGEEETAYNSLFRDGNVLMTTGWLMHTDSYRDLSFDYGVLPYPKWDENQESYNTTVLTSYSVLSIPTDVADMERSAAVCEAIAFESWKTVTPAYFEIALKVKYSRDNDSTQMFDIIKDGVSFDFGYIYTTLLGDVAPGFKNAVYGKQNWARTIAAKQSAVEQQLADLIENIKSANS